MGTKLSDRSFKFHKKLVNNLVIFIILFYSPSVLGSTCREGCSSASKVGKLKYAPGNVYNYNLDSTVNVYLAGSDAQETTLKIVANAQIFASAKCSYTLKLTSALVYGPDGKKNDIIKDLDKPIRFTLSNDELSPEICTDNDDNEFSLNIKRSIISLLQSADGKSFETDIFGTCPTTFSSTKTGQTSIVTKVRNLNMCVNRENLVNGLVTSVFNEKSGVKTTPILNGDYSAEQRIKNGIVEYAQLQEEYHFLPFTSTEAGARAKAMTKLTLTQGTGKGAAPKINSEKPRTIIFTNPKVIPISNLNTLKAVLKKTVESYDNHVGPKAASQFVDLIRLMRNTKRDDLLTLYRQIKAGTVHDSKRGLVRKIFFDALFRTGTGDSVEVCANLLKSELTVEEKQLAYMSLHLVESMTKEALNSIIKLLDGDAPKEAYLAVGSLVNKYCQHSCDAKEIKVISDKFVAKLGNCKAENRAQEDMLVAVLKGIRNTNNLVNPALDKVILCSSDKSSTRVRVAALKTLAIGSCAKKVQDTVLAILKNRNEDSEIRIEAYLALVKCPSGNVANELKALLDTETVYQVGSYITSHLASIRASTDPHRDLARSHFNNIRSISKFPSDFRRYSFNKEFSYAIESLGLGASIDTNVIYSQKSFLPRSGSFNLTGELFGNSFNIFELNGRQENLDRIIEHYFGPKGVIKSKSDQELFDLLFSSVKKVKEHTEGQVRHARGVREDVNAFGRSVNLGNDILGSDIDLDFSLKMFGTELAFLSLGQHLPSTPNEFLDKFLDCLDKGLNQVKNYDYTFEKHSILFDADLVYPTGSGFPLKLIAHSAGVVRFEASGQIDLREVVSDFKKTKFNFKVVPSYNYEVTGTILIDGSVVSTGLQVMGGVHSSTGADIKFALMNDGKGVDVRLGLPLKKQEIFSFDHKVIFVIQERGHETVSLPMKFSSKKKDYHGCFDQLHRYIGVTFCADASITVPGNTGVAAFPLNGNNHVSVWLEVDSAFVFNANYNDDNPNHPYFVASFDTPGSQDDRKTKIKMEAATQPNIFSRISIESPYRNVAAEAGMNNDQKEFALYAKGENGPDKYLVKLGFQKSGSTNKQEYSPIIIVQGPKDLENKIFGYKVTGKIIVDSTSTPTKYNFNKVEITGPSGPPFQINGLIFIDGPKIGTDLVFQKANQRGTAKGHFEFSMTHMDLDLTLESNFDPNANGRVSYKMTRSDTHMKNDFFFVFGNDLKSATNRLEIYQNFIYTLEGKTVTAVEFENKLKAPFAQLNFKLDGEYNKNAVKYDFLLGIKNEFASNLDAKVNVKNIGEYDIDFGASINKHSIKLDAKRVILDNKSKLNNKLAFSTGTQFEVNGLVGHTFTSQDADVSLEGVAVFGEKQRPYKINFNLLVTPKNVNSNAKIIQGKTEFLNYIAKVTRGESNNGNFELVIKDILNGKADYKSQNGKGDGNALIVFDKLDRKLKITTKFTILAPLYDISTDFYYDYEKDNKKKIHFSTVSKVTKKDFDSKNSLEILSEKYDFNVQGSLNGKLQDGILKSKFDLTFPTGRQLFGDITREAHFKEEQTGHFEITLGDRLPNRKARSVRFTGKINKGQFQSKIFDITHTLTYTDFDNKNLIVETTVKHLPVGDFKTASALINFKGSLVPQVTEINFSIDEYCEEHAVFTVSSKYGKMFNGKINGNYHIGGRSKPTTYTITANLDVPNAEDKNIKLESSGSLIQPETEGGLYDGSFSVFVHAAGKKLGIETFGKGNDHHGSGKLNVILPESNPFGVEGSYSHEEQNDVGKCECGVQLTYGQGQVIKGNVVVNIVGQNEVSLHATLLTPYENAKKSDLTFKATKSGDETFNTVAQLNIDEKTYGFNTEFISSETNPSINIVLIYPGVKDMKLSAGFNRLGVWKYKGHVKMENLADFNMIGNGEVDIQNIESFYIKLDVDSKKLKLNKVHIEINSKPGSGGKGVEFKASAENKNIISGFADYTVKEEKGKTIIEGLGNVKLYDKQKSASFKFIRNNFEAAKDGETGVLFVFNGYFGPKNIVAELKLTDKTFQMKYTVCEEKHQCVNLEIRSLLLKSDFENFQHELLISIDLRELGYSHEFGFKAETSRDRFTLDHTVDMHLQSQDKSKYQYNLYIHPEKAGIVITLPMRTIALEGVFKVPKDFFGHYDTSVGFYLDKQHKPNNKAVLGFFGDATRTGKSILSGTGTLKFSHPSLKALTITGSGDLNGDTQSAKGRLEFDVFRSPDQKIIVTGKYGNMDQSGKGFNITAEAGVSSRGLGLEYSFNGHSAFSVERRQLSAAGSVVSPSNDVKVTTYLFLSEEMLEILVTGFNEELVNVKGTFDIHKSNVAIDSKLQLLSSTPVIASTKIYGFTSIIFDLTKDKLVNVNGEFTVGKQALLQIKGSGKQIFKGRIALDQSHFLASEYKVDDSAVKEFLKVTQESIKTDAANAKGQLQNRMEKIRTTLTKQGETIKNSLPDFTNIQNDYDQQLQSLVDELNADKTIKEIIDFVKAIATSIGNVFMAITSIFLDIFHKVNTFLVHFYKKVSEIYKDKFLQPINDIFSKLEAIVRNIYEETFSLLSAIFERVMKALKTFEDDFNKVAKVVSDIFKEIAATITANLEQLRKEISEFYQLVVDTIKSCHGFEFLKEKYETFIAQYNLPEQLTNILKEFTKAITDHLPNKEVADFIKNLSDFIEAQVLLQKDENYLEQLEKLYDSFVKAVRSLIDLIRSQSGEVPSGVFAPMLFSFDSFKRLPAISNIKFSPWNYMRNEKWLSIRDIFQIYRPYAFNPFEFIPPFAMHAQVADGEHIFTFDGRHLTFPGSCSYILVQDFENGNFSLVANLQNGKLKSINLIDKSDFIEISDQGIVSLNGKPSELPVHQNDIHAWRRYYTVTLMTRYGVQVMCSTDLRVCHFSVSGFYLGKVRGILGNGNGEPWDDFTLPNGKVTENFADFGNAYKSVKTCPSVPYTDHSQHAGHSSEICAKLFSSDSTLRMCFLFVDQSNYREACEHAVAKSANQQDAACNIANVYASACRLENIPVLLPTQCAKCSDSGTEYSIGDTFSVKTPQKKADVVVVVDTALGNLLTDFVTNVITDLRKDLKARDYADVRIAVITYNKDQKYLSHITTNGKLDFTGKLIPGKMEGPQYEKPIKTGNEQIDTFLKSINDCSKKLREDLGLSSDALAFQEAMLYPFRSSASKIILAIRSDALTESNNPTKAFGAALSNNIAKYQGINVHLISPVNEFALTGKDAKMTKNVVGFNSKTVILLSDAKKRLNSPNLRPFVKYAPDMGIDLVQDVNGFVFVLKNYNTWKAAKDKRLFVGALTSALAEQTARTEVLSDCLCDLSYGLHAKEKCIAKEINLLPPGKTPQQRG